MFDGVPSFYIFFCGDVSFLCFVCPSMKRFSACLAAMNLKVFLLMLLLVGLALVGFFVAGK